MIAYLKGTLVKILDNQIIILCNNIGYLVYVQKTAISRYQEKQALELYIYTHVKENDICLYGFEKEDELFFFKQLISVSGIGPKTGMMILAMPIDRTKQAILDNHVAYLESIPGLGKKSAARLILELKGKIALPSVLKNTLLPKALEEEAFDALLRLGYEKHHILKFFHEQDLSFHSAEELIKHFLQSV